TIGLSERQFESLVPLRSIKARAGPRTGQYCNGASTPFHINRVHRYEKHAFTFNYAFVII
ncbi:MAG: hypothetical protein Q4F21_14675, partial [Lachnospiraceae bacterium]|nr:hypothetical protein [Lachnospiraceae bacterium]